MKTRCCTYCGSVLTGRNHCQICGQPDYDRMYGHLDRLQEAERQWRELMGLGIGPQFIEPSYVNATVQGVASDAARVGLPLHMPRKPF